MNDILAAATYSRPSRIPVSVSLLPATWMKYGQALDDMRFKFPLVFGENIEPMANRFYTPDSYRAGTFTDAWGCVLDNISEGYESIVTGHPISERSQIRSLKAPDVDIGLPHGFMFLRLLDLRGFEEAMVDFAEEPEELQMLIDIVRDYNIRQARLMVKNSPDEPMYYIGDDNGMQTSLPISPAKWRKYIYPAYKAIYSVFRDAGKLVYMHTDGCIWQVIPDFIKAGANVLNPQFRANGLDNLVKTCKGKVCIDLDLDRQMFPFAKPDDIKKHVLECTKALYMPEGGLMLKAECASDVPLENIYAICEALSEATNYRG